MDKLISEFEYMKTSGCKGPPLGFIESRKLGITGVPYFDRDDVSEKLNFII